jgi:predicted GNAT family acetyltransferase
VSGKPVVAIGHAGPVDVAVVDDVAEFAELGRPLLAADPVRHTVLLTVLDGAVRGGAPVELMVVARESGRVAGVALRSPGRLLLVSAMPASFAAAVADVVAREDASAPGVAGPEPEAELFARAIAERTAAAVCVRTRTRLFVLVELVGPAGVPGRARSAGAADVGVLADWRRAFAEEAHGGWTDPEPAQDQVRRSMRLGSAEVLWEVDGIPVSQASARPVLAGTSRIGPVYTPPEHRGRGFAAAVTAAASRWALDAGAERVLLFTDLANPTTNALYPRIGYRPVQDFADLALVPSTGAPR